MPHEIVNICMHCSECGVRFWIKKKQIENMDFITWGGKVLTFVDCPSCSHTDELQFDEAISYYAPDMD